MFYERCTVLLDMRRIPANIDEAGIILRRRLHDAGLSQAEVARMFGKSRAWGSQELFSDPKKTLRRMMIDQPATVAEFARSLGWADRDEMISELDLFDDDFSADPARSGPPIPPVIPFRETPITIPPQLLEMVEKHGDDYPVLKTERMQRMLAAPRAHGGLEVGPQTVEDWFDYWMANKRFLT